MLDGNVVWEAEQPTLKYSTATSR